MKNWLATQYREFRIIARRLRAFSKLMEKKGVITKSEGLPAPTYLPGDALYHYPSNTVGNPNYHQEL